MHVLFINVLFSNARWKCLNFLYCTENFSFVFSIFLLFDEHFLLQCVFCAVSIYNIQVFF